MDEKFDGIKYARIMCNNTQSGAPLFCVHCSVCDAHIFYITPEMQNMGIVDRAYFCFSHNPETIERIIHARQNPR